MIIQPHKFDTDEDAQVVHFASTKSHGSVQRSLVRQMCISCVATLEASTFFSARLQSRTVPKEGGITV